MDAIDIILTSCGRFDLLEKSLDSLSVNTHPVSKFIVYDDYGLNNLSKEQCRTLDRLRDKFPYITFMFEHENKGQIYSIDKMMQYVTTPYYFSTEDDFIFDKGGFIEKSIEILEENGNIISVCVTDCNQHRRHGMEEGYKTTKSDIHYSLTSNYRHGYWGGFSFCPSVRRLRDYIPYGSITSFDINNPSKSEIELSKYYLSKNKRTARLTELYGKHIGEKRHIGKKHWTDGINISVHNSN